MQLDDLLYIIFGMAIGVLVIGVSLVVNHFVKEMRNRDDR